jgi:prophage regulatory protein
MAAEPRPNPWAAPPDTPLLPRFLRIKHVREITGLGTSTIYHLAQRGAFPKPFKLTGKASAWRSDEVEAWQRERLAG